MKLPPPNLWERGLAAIAPKHALASYQARVAFAGAGQYAGARVDKTSLRSFTPAAGSADSDSIGDLPTLRARSRDLSRNAGIARGARNTSTVNVVGTGLRLKATLQRELLGLSDEQAEAWEDYTEVLFDLWAREKTADVTRTQNFYELQSLAFTSAFDSGDVFTVRRYKEGPSFLALCLALVEADRVSTPANKSPSADIRDGVEIDGDGAAVAYHVRNNHPGDDALKPGFEPESWARIPAFGEADVPLILHLFARERIGQSRGIPSLAAVIDDLKQLDRYSEAELMAAVVSAFFTVFVKNNGTDTSAAGLAPEAGSGPMGGDGQYSAPGQVALGAGSIVDLAPGEDVTIANPNRPNPNFDPFFLAIIRKIGVSLGIPYEVLIMHFSSSYSASKAALEVAWQFFMERRTWLTRNFCQPVYEWFLYECVARGLIDAPGFMDDPIKRAAWCGCDWVGPCQISIDPTKEAEAAEAWIDLGVETVKSVTFKTNGGDWFRNSEQRGREIKQRKLTGQDITPARPEIPKPEPKPANSGGSNAGS